MQESQNPTYFLAWIPESLLNEKGSTEWEKFVKIEERALQDQEDDGMPLFLTYFLDHTSAHFVSQMLSSLTFQRSDQSHMLFQYH
jgi:hypothetical protein